jgi:hypothetical protein
MKARHIILSIALVLFVFSLGQAAPHLSISQPVFDFGYAPQHSKISHIFWLKNTGDDTLKILKVVPG